VKGDQVTPVPSTENDRGIFAWFIVDRHWSRVALVVAIALLIVSPLLPAALGLAAFLIFLQLPLYMLHQFEEHGQGAFKAFMNANRSPGMPELTDRTIFWINSLGVWLMNLVALAVARSFKVAAGLVSPYVSVVNGVLHVGMALRQRRYNPGLWTSLLLLIPVGAASIVTIGRSARVSRRQHLIALAGAIVLHAVTFAWMRRQPTH